MSSKHSYKQYDMWQLCVHLPNADSRQRSRCLGAKAPCDKGRRRMVQMTSCYRLFTLEGNDVATCSDSAEEGEVIDAQALQETAASTLRR